MHEHRGASYELSEMAALKRMYDDLHRMSPGESVMLGELEFALVGFGAAFRNDAVIRNNFRKFAGKNFGEIEAVANYYADYKVNPEDLMILVTK